MISVDFNVSETEIRLLVVWVICGWVICGWVSCGTWGAGGRASKKQAKNVQDTRDDLRSREYRSGISQASAKPRPSIGRASVKQPKFWTNLPLQRLDNLSL